MRTRDRLATWFPPPLLGVALLLVVLIILTPDLTSTGAPPAGSFPTQAELIVDRGTSEPNVTHLYVKSVGNVRYLTITMAVATNLTWPIEHGRSIAWNATVQVNDSLVLLTTTTANPVAVNVTAVYIDSTGQKAAYAGTYAFYFHASFLYTEPISTGATAVPPTAISSLPLYLLLTSIPTGGS